MNLSVKIRKNLGDFVLDVAFDTGEGVLGLLGASGCGKSMTLKCIAGIEKPDEGRIVLNDRVLFDSETGINVPPQKRGVGYLFQDYALFPNMTVLDNVMYALNLKLKDKEKARKESLEMLKLVNMEDHLKKYPHELSGGQQQRVAIARTLSLHPDIILFDEPMSALDADNRLGLRKELKKLQKKFKTTMIYITHDQEEAFSLSDRVMVMNNGNIEQIDIPNKIYNNPANEYVRNFVTKHLNEKVSSIEKCTGVDL